jgi:hypothetical protein
MAEEYFFAKEDKQFGPFTAAQLKKLADTGRLQPTDKVRKSSMANWVSAAAVKGLFQATTASPAGAAPPAAAAAPPPTPSSPTPKPVPPVEEIMEAVLIEEDDESVAEAEPLVAAESLVPEDEPQAARRTRKPPVPRDVLEALKHLASNPVGHLAQSYRQLGKTNAMIVGLVCAVLFDVCLMLGVYFIVMKMSFQGPPPRDFGPPSAVEKSFPWKDLLKLIGGGVIPPIGFAAGILACRKLFRGSESFESDIFIGGIALLPMALVFAVAPLLGMANWEVIVLLLIFAICLTILLLFAGCTKIQKISEGASTLAIPLIIVLSGWITKMLLTALFS